MTTSPELRILSIIDSAAPLMMPRQALLDTIYVYQTGNTLTEIDSALRVLESAGQIIVIANPDAPGGRRYTLTDQGRARLAAAGLL
jgi:hypothetical protein